MALPSLPPGSLLGLVQSAFRKPLQPNGIRQLLISEIVLAMEIHVPPARYRTILDHPPHLPLALSILLLPDLVRQREVIPAADGVLAEASAPLGNVLCHFFTVQKLMVVAARAGLRELIGVFAFVELLFDRLSKLYVIDDAQDKIRFGNFAELCKRLLPRMLLGGGVEPPKELRRGRLLPLHGGDKAQNLIPLRLAQGRFAVPIGQ